MIIREIQDNGGTLKVYVA